MKQIYTKTGDAGMTSLREGERVPKTDLRIETNGQIDQLNACLGVVRSMLGADEDNRQLVYSVQQELMAIMSHVATPEGYTNPRPLHAAELTRLLEKAIDAARYAGGFVVPGGGAQLASFIHLARAQARTVERRLWELNACHPLDKSILEMMNRLSDYLFVLAIAKE